MAAPTPVKRKRSEIQEAETPVKESREPVEGNMPTTVCFYAELFVIKTPLGFL